MERFIELSKNRYKNAIATKNLERAMNFHRQKIELPRDCGSIESFCIQNNFVEFLEYIIENDKLVNVEIFFYALDNNHETILHKTLENMERYEDKRNEALSRVNLILPCIQHGRISFVERLILMGHKLDNRYTVSQMFEKEFHSQLLLAFIKDSINLEMSQKRFVLHSLSDKLSQEEKLDLLDAIHGYLPEDISHHLDLLEVRERLSKKEIDLFRKITSRYPELEDKMHSKGFCKTQEELENITKNEEEEKAPYQRICNDMNDLQIQTWP